MLPTDVQIARYCGVGQAARAWRDRSQLPVKEGTVRGLFIRTGGPDRIPSCTTGPLFEREAVRKVVLNDDGVQGSFEWHKRDKNAAQGKDRHVNVQCVPNYEHLATAFPEDELFQRALASDFEFGMTPAFGENMIIDGFSSEDVCIGDVFSCGSSLLQVACPRRYCWKVNKFHGTRGKQGRESVRDYCNMVGNAGFFFKVLKHGEVRMGDRLRLLARPHPGWTAGKVLRLFWAKPGFVGTPAQVADLLTMPELSWFQYKEEASEVAACLWNPYGDPIAWAACGDGEGWDSISNFYESSGPTSGSS